MGVPGDNRGKGASLASPTHDDERSDEQGVYERERRQTYQSRPSMSVRPGFPRVSCLSDELSETVKPCGSRPI